MTTFNMVTIKTYIFILTYNIICFVQLTFNSNTATAIPSAAPDPAKPIKCSDPILLANKDAPT